MDDYCVVAKTAQLSSLLKHVLLFFDARKHKVQSSSQILYCRWNFVR